ncbi:hypothetical protein BDZ89DRAFT_1153595 [Hymenopellis radicata]|nr:hypothetical protein BDZ89DRAFT_1153595 [Hymenopellis radicata]
MRKFFTKAPKAPVVPPPPPPVVVPVPHLQPKYVVPAVPAPSPYDHIALLVTKEGLLLRPHGAVGSLHGVRISWGKAGKVEEIVIQGEWEDSVVVHGIVGILELFSASHLLVITTKNNVGTFLEDLHAVHGVKGITAIPLTEEAARIRINTLASRSGPVSPLSTSHTLDSVSSSHEQPSNNPGPDDTPRAITPPPKSGPRVQFSPLEPPDKLLTPVIDLNTDEHSPSPSPSPYPRSPSDSSSDLSTESPTGSPVIKAIASRLSFWKKPIFPPTPEQEATQDDATTTPEEAERLLMEDKQPEEVLASILAPETGPVSTEERHSELEEKIVRECIKEFTKGGMYFAYNFDITRSMQQKRDQIAKAQKETALLADLNVLPNDHQSHHGNVSEPTPTLPLWRRVDRQFWWNEFLAKPFIDAGLHPYVLPIMQGYCQIASFVVDGETIDYIVVSRRSRDRAGLRYQRRGVDDEAHVANFVETETVVRIKREGKTNTFSYVQIRGSIPLFWTQTGYGLKPPPVLAPEHTHAQNLDAIRRHFAKTVPKYGPHVIVNLAEEQGKEGALTQAYKTYSGELASPEVQYNEYDFHVETKGMKYENISKLIERMERTFEGQGYLWLCEEDVLSTQKGVFRVNCIDCLDRTNVVQSAFARYVLGRQLGAVALLVEGKREEVDVVFNDMWANNGDAISRAYAGTSALKGDFTRTGKRDLSGLLNDGVNSLARMYTSTFSDWFCQAVIDFMLGHRTLSVFSEFLLKLQSTDPSNLIRLSKIRSEAIATSVSRVLEEGERLLSGWTMFAPDGLNVRVGDKWEEKVLLLTVRAIYIISYDYTLQKVKKYTRVPLGDVVSISKGAYILSPLEEASRDSEQNAGFVIEWLNSHEITRVTSYSVRNSFGRTFFFSTHTTGVVTAKGMVCTKVQRKSFAAFKMLPIDPARLRRTSSDGYDGPVIGVEETEGAGSCREAVDMIVERIRSACEDSGSATPDFVKVEDVVGLAEAQRMTSMYAKMEYGVKRLLWLGG